MPTHFGSAVGGNPLWGLGGFLGAIQANCAAKRPRTTADMPAIDPMGFPKATQAVFSLWIGGKTGQLRFSPALPGSYAN